MPTQPIFKSLICAAIITFVMITVNRVFGTAILAVIIGIAGLTAYVCWMLQYRRIELATYYKKPFCKPYIQLVCKLSRCQPPVERTHESRHESCDLILRQPADFQRAKGMLQNCVTSHRDAISSIMDRLQEEVLLRSKSNDFQKVAPLGAFALCGPAGSGKAFLAQQIGNAVNRSRSVLRLSMGQFSDPASLNTLLGSTTKEGMMTRCVRKNPLHTIIFEELDQAHASVQQVVASILRDGQYRDPSTKAPITFQHCVFFIIVENCTDQIRTLRNRSTSSELKWNLDCEQLLVSETQLAPELARHIGQFVWMSPLTHLERAEVILRLMEGECARYGIALEYIDPHVLAHHVKTLDEESGFEPVVSQIRRYLKEQLLSAARNEAESIRIYHPTTQKLEEQLA